MLVVCLSTTALGSSSLVSVRGLTVRSVSVPTRRAGSRPTFTKTAVSAGISSRAIMSAIIAFLKNVENVIGFRGGQAGLEVIFCQQTSWESHGIPDRVLLIRMGQYFPC